MGKIDTEALRESAEEHVGRLIAKGYSEEVAISMAAAALESFDDLIPGLDRALDEDDYQSVIEWVIALFRNPERATIRKARAAFRDVYETRRLPDMLKRYGASKAAREARKGWRRAWRKSAERAEVKP